MIKKALAAILIALPGFAYAAEGESFKSIVYNKLVPFGDVIVTLLYALAFLYFIIGMVRFFFSMSDEGREQGKQHAFWGIIAFVVLFSVWGIVRLLLSVIGV
jgi:hypothetical protein